MPLAAYENIVDIDLWTAIFTFCNMIITFLVLKKLLFKPVKKMIDDRQKEIDDMYSQAEQSQEKADAMQAEYKQYLREANQKRDEIIRDATRRAEKREKEIIDAANSDANRIRAKAEAEITQEKKKALNDVKDEISVIAVEIAAKVVDRELSASDHDALVEDFIGKIGDEV